MPERDPFHEGERRVQERTGERAHGERNGKIVRDALAPAAAAFLAVQRSVAIAALDPRDRIWASLWLGARGFVFAAEARQLRVDRSTLREPQHAPLSRGLTPGAPLGLLAIDFATRRRLRINGSVGAVSREQIAVDIHESFANCPKYIQQRELGELEEPARHTEFASGTALDESRRTFVTHADTLFVASRHATRGLDVSHRGGEPGFVRLLDERTLRIPDYPGNSMFMTLGNFELDPRAGLVLIDFERGRQLALTGSVRVSYGVEHVEQPSGNTGRYWEFKLSEWHEQALGARFSSAHR